MNSLKGTNRFKGTNSFKETLELLVPEVQKKTILGLIGDLGYGKTTLVSELLGSFGLKMTSSPTFSLINPYRLANGLRVYHVDLYRLKNFEEIEASGFWDLFADEEAFFIIEWIDRLDIQELPFHFKKIILTISLTMNDLSKDPVRSYHLNWLSFP